MEKALDIASDLVPDQNRSNIQLYRHNDHDGIIYEGYLMYSGGKYKFVINGNNGEVIVFKDIRY